MSNATGPHKVDVKAGETKAICACGKSKNKGLCDGSHAKDKHPGPKVMKFDKDQSLYVCACGKTSNSPNCDGSHKK